MKSTREAYGETLAILGKKDENIVVLDADLTHVTKTNLFQEKFGNRHVNVGISEQDLIGTACGLAASGKNVFVSTMAMFMAGRAYDQIRNSVAYSNLGVKLCATHAGLCVGPDGATHQMIEDIALMRIIPNMMVFSPADEVSTKKILEEVKDLKNPVYIRLGRNTVPKIYEDSEEFKIGNIKTFGEGKDATIFATGYTMHIALEAQKILKDYKIKVRVADIYSIKPLPKDDIIKFAKESKVLISIEDHLVSGGMGSAIAECLIKHYPKELVMIGVEDKFGRSGKAEELMNVYNITKERIIEEIIKKLKGE